MPYYMTVMDFGDEHSSASADVIHAHNNYLKQHKPRYGFLFSNSEYGNTIKHIFIELELDTEEAVYLSLILNVRFVPGSQKSRAFKNIDLSSFGLFRSVSYFQMP